MQRYFLLGLKAAVIVSLLLLPYYIFGNKLYVGGDDTKLFYSYPLDFFKHITFFSWMNNSSIGINGPNQYLAPFLGVWYLLSLVIPDKVFLNHLAMSLPLILGFIYFQKSLKELFQLDEKTDLELLLGSLFFILSPILIINQMFVFLISIWLIALIPIVIYYFLRYLRTSNFLYVYIASLWCLLFSFALYTVPWLLGFVLPLLGGLVVLLFLSKKRDTVYFLKHAFIFTFFIILSQAFWLTGFISTYLNLHENSLASKFVSKGFVDTFTPTILSTATGNIMFPLLNLFHRQIPFDFVWKLKYIFSEFYDKIFVLNVIYIIILALGVFNFKKYLNDRSQKIYILIFTSFMISLYCFTVNIGPLKDLFILFGQIPGFTMFRNFYDKFAPGYVIIYASLISISLVMVSKKFSKKRPYILAAFLAIVLLNFAPVRGTVNSPLWTTNDIYKTINIPSEYLSFMASIGKNISSTNTIFSVPFGTSTYSVIKDDSSSSVYAGVSPVRVFSGVNDISGHLSFNFTKEADVVDKLIIDRKYKDLNNILFEHNINYILLTKNIPNQLIDSYLFNTDLFNSQDKEFLTKITSKKIETSTAGNYELYKTKKQNSIINAKNAYFKKETQVKYTIYLKGVKNKQSLGFVDSFHAGWKLFPVKNPSLSFCSDPIANKTTGSAECVWGNKLFEAKDVLYLFKKDIFSNTHTFLYKYANQWVVDPSYIKKNYSKEYYTENKDGSINIMLELYFVPQVYFYIGILISCIVFLAGAGYIYFSLSRHEKKKK